MTIAMGSWPEPGLCGSDKGSVPHRSGSLLWLPKTGTTPEVLKRALLEFA